ncbi:YSIRK-type signal peptide-containing protein [Lactobacillus helveticus]|nr:YSIRK-type signal peptide-containing protein [Lactobacillus helveticus]MCT0164891.1 YSIRK-type signal peptide-containing protein [Lactobacillus helveticus]MCT0192940.1 YSIRK-type signal peptide-containing protein [Lactobacillus helveticus]MCT0197113.1 YSIRK-type signal peptide-containing protein [Lactobacillus helveticus]
MLKNNCKSLMNNMRNEHQRFSLRKYSIGVVSVLIGLAFFGVNTTTVHADENGQAVKSVEVNKDENSATTPDNDNSHTQKTNGG